MLWLGGVVWAGGLVLGGVAGLCAYLLRRQERRHRAQLAALQDSLALAEPRLARVIEALR